MRKPSLHIEIENLIRKRHEILLREHIKLKKKKIYKIDNYKLVVYPDVFPPFDDSLFFYRFLKNLKNPGSVLDMGTGSGVLSLAVNKTAKEIIAVDINKEAIKSLKETIKANKLEKIKAKFSNIFSNINKKFDTITFNPPFMYFKPKNNLEKAICNQNYKDLERFFKQVRKYLKKKGKIYMIFSDIGDINYLKRLIEKNKFKYKILKEKKAIPLVGNERFYYYIFEIK